MGYDSFALAAPSVTMAPLWKSAVETTSGFQTQPQAQTVTVQAQTITSTPAKPSGIKFQMQATAHARLQAPAQAQPQAPAQPPRPAQAYFSQPQAAVTLGARRVPYDFLHNEDRLSMDFEESEASLIAKQARSELLDRVATFCS